MTTVALEAVASCRGVDVVYGADETAVHALSDVSLDTQGFALVEQRSAVQRLAVFAHLPIVRVALQHHLRAALPGFQDERTGTDRMLARIHAIETADQLSTCPSLYAVCVPGCV